MSGEIIKIIRRFLIISIIQILILKYIDISWEGETYIRFFIYPLFIMLIPISIPTNTHYFTGIWFWFDSRYVL